MRQQLWTIVHLTLASIFYSTVLPPVFIATSFFLGLLRIPLLTALVLTVPGQADLIRIPHPDDPTHQGWFPRAFPTSNTIVTILFYFLAFRDMDLATDVHGSLATDFEIFLAPESRWDDVLWKAIMSGAAVTALEVGKKTSFAFVPLLYRAGLFEWGTDVIERTDEEEREVEEWSLQPWRKGF